MRSTSARSPLRCEASDERRRPHPRADPAGHGAGAARRARPARAGRWVRGLPHARAGSGRAAAAGAAAAAVRRPGGHAAGRRLPALGAPGRAHPRAPRRRRRARHDAGHARPLARGTALARHDARPPRGHWLGDRGERGDADRDPARAVDGVGGAADAGTRADGARPRRPRLVGVLRQRRGPARLPRSARRRRGRAAGLPRVRLVRRSAARSPERSGDRVALGLLLRASGSSPGRCPRASSRSTSSPRPFR